MIASLLSPTWSNDETAPNILFFPAPFLSVTVLAVNLLGGGLRDALDSRMAKRAAHGATRGGRFVTLAQVETLERLVEGDGSVGVTRSAGLKKRLTTSALRLADSRVPWPYGRRDPQPMLLPRR